MFVCSVGGQCGPNLTNTVRFPVLVCATPFQNTLWPSQLWLEFWYFFSKLLKAFDLFMRSIIQTFNYVVCWFLNDFFLYITVIYFIILISWTNYVWADQIKQRNCEINSGLIESGLDVWSDEQVSSNFSLIVFQKYESYEFALLWFYAQTLE